MNFPKTSKSTTKSEINWKSNLSSLFKGPSKTALKLNEAGVETLEDLLWVFPKKIELVPPVRPFHFIEVEKLFVGRAKILNIVSRPNFRARGKGGALLKNITVHVQDLYSPHTLTLQWFNTYSSVEFRLKKLIHIEFSGTVQFNQGKKMIINPQIDELADDNLALPEEKSNLELKIHYPMVNGLNGPAIQKVFDKIPSALWNNIIDELPEEIKSKRKFTSLAQAFKTIHAIGNEWSPEKEEVAKNRLIYQEFFHDQIKITLRKTFFKSPLAPKFHVTKEHLAAILKLFPFPLTEDQLKTVNEIQADLASGHPMMRLVQGDVGCGKTWLGFIATLITKESGFQTAFMCPTESLALQHFLGAKELFQESQLRVRLLLGSTSAKEKKIILEELKKHEIDLLIGTHSLIQETVQFAKLGLAIIDEQHKFGVEQRIQLTKKGEGVHCLIMSATPIPRSLSLTRYGDLDISTIRTMPGTRKGQKTRIVTEETFPQYLTFLSTRLSMGEQVYVVVPAITENEDQDFHNLEDIFDRYKKYFPKYRIAFLHGKMKAQEKAQTFYDFKDHKIDLLVSTSVIEVGINVHNATIIAILNPERFGLSSLHQLRGRVGRGQKQGFCFLVNDKTISQESMQRLKVIEEHHDGFKIAEEDLKIRGEGDLFGTEQSGDESTHRLASLITHSHLLDQSREDLQELLRQKNPYVRELFNKFSKDEKIFKTV